MQKQQNNVVGIIIYSLSIDGFKRDARIEREIETQERERERKKEMDDSAHSGVAVGEKKIIIS
jgi:hypothetical protein